MKRLVVVVVLSLVVAACGGGSGPVESGSGARALTAPDVEPAPTTTLKAIERIALGEQPLDEPEAGSETMSTDLPPLSSDPCTALRDGLTGAYGFDLYLASGTPAEGPLLAAVFGGFGSDAVALADRLVAYDGSGGAALLDVVDAVTALDTLTFAECGVPGAAAYFSVMGAMAITRFACVSESISGAGGEKGECEESVRRFPHELPCFEPASAGGSETPIGGVSAWETVDCSTGVKVAWDHDAGAWTEFVSATEKFKAVDEAIG